MRRPGAQRSAGEGQSPPRGTPGRAGSGPPAELPKPPALCLGPTPPLSTALPWCARGRGGGGPDVGGARSRRPATRSPSPPGGGTGAGLLRPFTEGPAHGRWPACAAGGDAGPGSERDERGEVTAGPAAQGTTVAGHITSSVPVSAASVRDKRKTEVQRGPAPRAGLRATGHSGVPRPGPWGLPSFRRPRVQGRTRAACRSPRVPVPLQRCRSMGRRREPAPGHTG